MQDLAQALTQAQACLMDTSAALPLAYAATTRRSY